MELNQGVEILLARMDSNPDEFASEFYEAGVYQRKLGKWEWLVDALKCTRMEDRKAALPYLTNQEIEALYSKYQELLRDNFTKRVMAILLPEEEQTMQYERKIRLSRSQMEFIKQYEGYREIPR